MSPPPPFGYEFRQAVLLETALTHPSCEGERPDYQRLEFLGDAVLGLVVAEQLYTRHPDATEGELASMRAAVVNGGVLAAKAGMLQLGAAIRVSEAHRSHQPEASAAMLEDAFEALIGAIYQDGGLEAARNWIARQLAEELANAQTCARSDNPKGRLQEWAQRRGIDLPQYELTEASGPDHGRFYEVSVRLGGEALAEGSGRSIKAAEAAAAERALVRLEDGRSA